MVALIFIILRRHNEGNLFQGMLRILMKEDGRLLLILRRPLHEALADPMLDWSGRLRSLSLKPYDGLQGYFGFLGLTVPFGLRFPFGRWITWARPRWSYITCVFLLCNLKLDQSSPLSIVHF